ncbi:hypothetical protein PUMCH_001906 [Australozyma saopauloensis]|uniref:Bul1 N-terminal domain-containing protein n=1 Tax=Australozyma saopauloensis TaxID=291208 RepID=A0AAX4H9Q0_9ASCO|nr:hypothetical protein PUMCH_001906 [[Candida] saopauloensis]
MDSDQSKSSNELSPLASARSQNGDDLINTILPSYHMFQSTVSKKLVPNEESFKEDPPRYELSPLNSAGLTPVASRAEGAPAVNLAAAIEQAQRGLVAGEEEEAGEGEAETEDVFNQKSADFWDKTILANVHNLDNLSEEKNELAQNLEVNLVFTQSVCQAGVRPDIIDVAQAEHRQGDYFHGYVTIKNTFSKPIPFDMVYVAFEGILCVKPLPVDLKDKVPNPVVFKFLNMLDLFASWSYANIDRLVTDSGDPHDWCEGETDPQDGTLLSIDVKRMFMPGVTYKRFFSFRIPERLLDDCCDFHSLDIHCRVPPSLGNAYNLNGSNKYHQTNFSFKDFTQVGSFIGYSVSARVIGRASQYGIKSKNDRYVLAAESSMPIRVIPYTISQLYTTSHNYEVNANFKDLLHQATSKIEQGQLVAEGLKNEGAGTLSSFIPLHANSSRTSLSLINDKFRHLYVAPSRADKTPKKEGERFFRHVSLYKKKSLTGAIKGAGTIYISTPQATYDFPYIPPPEFRNPFQGYKSTIRVPIEYSYVCEKNKSGHSMPRIKEISSELVVLTISSRKHEIPIEFNHEMCFDDEIIDDMGFKKPEELNSFETKVIKPFQTLYGSLISLMKKIGFDDSAFRVETKLFKDIKSLASLQMKRITVAMSSVTVFDNESGSLKQCNDLLSLNYEVAESPVNKNFDIHSKKLEVEIDLRDCKSKGFTDNDPKNGFDHMCLVPSFQMCFMSRIYYLRLTIKYRHGVTQILHVPISING